MAYTCNVDGVVYSSEFSDGEIDHVLDAVWTRDIDLVEYSAVLRIGSVFQASFHRFSGRLLVEVCEDDAFHSGFCE